MENTKEMFNKISDKAKQGKAKFVQSDFYKQLLEKAGESKSTVKKMVRQYFNNPTSEEENKTTEEK